jgi:hypothetical protein
MQSGVWTHRALPVSAGLAPCRHLAARVIGQALKDVLQPGQNALDRRTARSFLAGSTMLYYWCEIAGLDPTQVIQVAAMLTGSNEHGRSTSATSRRSACRACRRDPPAQRSFRA